MADVPASPDVPAGQSVFVAEFRRWGDLSGLSRAALATAMGYSRSYVSKVESGHEHASRGFVTTADAVLNTGGALWRAWREQEALRAKTGVRPEPVASAAATEPTGGLLVEHDHAELYYNGEAYRLTQRRQLVNHSGQPIARYLIRVSVDRYPGESTWIEYTYTVGDDKWGNWFRRAVRLPTRNLSVRLDFPANLDPAYGLHTSMAAESMPFQTAIHVQEVGDRRVYSWSTENPPLHARYRLEWHFRNQPHEAPPKPTRPSAMMKALGIVQDSDPVLRCPARPFILPAEAEDACRVISELQSATHRVAMAHIFGKGMGIAAPQIGIVRAAAIVRPPGSDDVITLLNPRVVDSSDDRDEQYEGCLSFFDVRCLVPRQLVIHVEHQDITGDRRITSFERGIARLVAHEVDHLHGILCRDHMRSGVQPVPVEQYRGTGTSWQYPAPMAR